MLCNEPGVLPGSDYYYATEAKINTKVHPYLLICGHYHCISGYCIDRQFYDAYQIIYVQDGILHFHFEGKEHEVKPGNVVLMDCRSPHRYYAGEHLETLWATYDGGNSREVYRDVHKHYGSVIRSENAGLVSEQLNAFISAYRNEQEPSSSLLSADIYRMLCALYPAETAAEHKYGAQPISTAMGYMRYHLTEDITLDDMASIAHMSKHHFARKFKETTDMTPHGYLVKLRLDMAKHMLVTTEKSIREIAYDVGYKSEMGLIMAFTDRIGISPGKYRQFPR